MGTVDSVTRQLEVLIERLPVQELFAQGCQEMGFRWAEDFNAEDAWDGVVGPLATQPSQ